MDMVPDDFAWITYKVRFVKTWCLGTEDKLCAQILEVADICCSGRVVSVLEGGYGSYHSHSQSRGTRTTGKYAAQVCARGKALAGAARLTFVDVHSKRTRLTGLYYPMRQARI
jgi:hypothetical protein